MSLSEDPLKRYQCKFLNAYQYLFHIACETFMPSLLCQCRFILGAIKKMLKTKLGK